MILFAYAGNMNFAEFAKNVPSAKYIGVGKLPGYAFKFNKTARDQSSKANVEKSDDINAAVWGILIELDGKERSIFYNPDLWSRDFLLHLLPCVDTDGNVYHAEVFVAQPHAINTHLLPYDWYHQKTLKLAKEAGLPAKYIKKLSLMPYKTDPDESRRLKRLKRL